VLSRVSTPRDGDHLFRLKVAPAVSTLSVSGSKNKTPAVLDGLPCKLLKMPGDPEKPAPATIDVTKWRLIREIELDRQKTPRVESRKGDRPLRNGDYAHIEKGAFIEFLDRARTLPRRMPHGLAGPAGQSVDAYQQYHASVSPAGLRSTRPNGGKKVCHTKGSVLCN
jgi:hypothetical protein